MSESVAAGVPAQDHARLAARKELLVVFLLNTVLTAFLQLVCVAGHDTQLHGTPVLALPAAILSQAAFLNLYPAVLVFVVSLVVKAPSVVRWVEGIVFGVAQCAILGDVAVFRLFGCHLLSLPMFRLLTTPGNADIFRPGRLTALVLLAAALVVIALSLWLSVALAKRLVAGSSWKRPVKVGLWAIVACAVVERSVFAWCSVGDPAVLQHVEETLTFYQAFDPKPLAERLGCLPRTVPPPLWEPSTALDLPKHPLVSATSGRLPNVLFLLMECGRADALTPKAMPNITRLGQEGWRLEQHFSTGNSTQPGCFGIFYGLPATYLPAVMAQKHTSPAVDFFIQRHYDFCLLFAAVASVSGLTDNAFRPLRDHLTDTWKCDHVSRDRLMTDAFLHFLDQRKARGAEQPFFGFLFYDATHVPYDYPPEDAVHEFNAQPGQVNYVSLLGELKASARFKNCYLNAAHYVDRQMGRVLDRLRESGEYDHTLIIVAGDHGEEFGECGHFGHLSGFNRFQIQTLAVVRLPGEAHREITNLTSHVDFMPTVLTYLGVTNALEDYTTGLPLQSSTGHRFDVVCDFRRNIGLVKPGSMTTFRPRGVTSQTLEEQTLSPKSPSHCTDQDLAELVKQSRWFFQN